MENTDPVVKQQAVAAHQIVIRWIPATGEIQFATSIPDMVSILGALEMAKVSILEKRIQALTGQQAPVIVPGRFAS